MLKGIVSGSPVDISRIAMRGKNLLDYNVLFGDNPDRTSTYFTYYKIVLEPNTQYTMITNVPNFQINECPYMFGTQNIMAAANDGVLQGIPKTVTSNSDGSVFIACRIIPNTIPERYAKKQYFDNGTYNIMLNLGSTALPYEPYGMQSGWEIRDQQGRIIWGREDELQTTTGTLPFKGYDLPVKVKSLLGNTVQNGTPSPNNPIIPEECGDKTANLNSKITTATATQTNGYYTDFNQNIGSEKLTQLYSEINSINGECCIDFKVDNDAFAPNLVVYFNDGTPYRDIREAPFKITNGSKVSNLIIRARSGSTDYDGVAVTMSDFMLNSGSTALPYEPYGYKISFDNNGENLFDCDRTEGITNNSYIRKSDGATVSDTNYYISYPIYVLEGVNYTWTFNDINKQGHSAPTVGFYDSSDNLIGSASHGSNVTYFAFTAPIGCKYIRTSVYKRDNLQKEAMLNLGSTPLPYSPYLNKTTPVYLGETPTIRRIKCVDLGTLTYTKTGSGNFSAALGDGKVVDNSQIAPAICSHFKVVSANNYSSTPYSLCASINLQSFVSINKAGYEEMTVAEFKSVMSGVLLWYALANPEIGIVNEPLAKIGDYADELNNTVATLPEIPTTTGQNTLTVDTTIAPSNLTVKGHIKPIQ